MTKLVFILVRKALPGADMKTTIFISSALCMAIGVLYGPVVEIWQGVFKYRMIEWNHIYEVHAGPVGASALSFWLMMKAADLIPDYLKNVPLAELQKLVDTQQMRTAVGTYVADKAKVEEVQAVSLPVTGTITAITLPTENTELK